MPVELYPWVWSLLKLKIRLSAKFSLSCKDCHWKPKTIECRPFTHMRLSCAVNVLAASLKKWALVPASRRANWRRRN